MEKIKMRYVMTIFAVFMILGCSDNTGVTSANKSPDCKASSTATTVTISCVGSVDVTIPIPTNGEKGDKGDNGTKGDTGDQGIAGQNGNNGHSASISMTLADSSICANGGKVISMGMDLNDDLSLQDSEITQVAVVCNGIDGQNGSNAQLTPFTPVALVMPCAIDPNNPTELELNDYNYEVFFRLSNGMLISSFSDNVSGYNTHFSTIPVGGPYMSTAQHSCVFNVDTDYNIVKN